MGSSERARSPLDMWRQFVPQGHDTSLRSAFYNVAAAVFVGGAGLAAWSVYHILQPFVQALMWAVLFGSVLHPVKYRITAIVNNWLHSVKESQSLLSFSLAILPINCIDSLSEHIGWYVLNHMKFVIAVTVFLPLTYTIIHFTPTMLSGLAYSLLSFIYYFIKYFLALVSYIHILVLLIVLIYIVTVCTNYTYETQKILKHCSLPVWFLFSAVLSSYISEVAAVPLFLLFCALLLCGIVVEAKDLQEFHASSGRDTTLLSNVLDVVIGDTENLSVEKDVQVEKVMDEVKPLSKVNEVIEEVEEITSNPSFKENSSIDETASETADTTHVRTITPPNSLPAFEAKLSKKSSLKKQISLEEENSNIYLKSVFLACILVQLWRHCYLLPLLPLTLLYYTVKKSTVYHLYGEGYLKGQVMKYQSQIKEKSVEFLSPRKQLLWPLPVRGLAKVLKQSDKRIVDMLSASVDVCVTIFVILVVTTFFVLVTLFLAVQIQGEGMQLVTMGTQLVNATIVNNPEFHAMLPEGIDQMMDSALDNGYLYGREWLTNMVRGVLGETDEDKAEALEKQVIELWDRIYQAWVVPPPQLPYRGPIMTTEAVTMSFENIMDGFFKTPGLISLSSLTDLLRDNIGTVMSVLDSVWTILLGNLSLALSVLSNTSSLVLGGSLSILNGIFNLIVFLSALFYVLSVSGEIYKPVSILTSLAPGQINSIGSAFEDSINGVFMASFKMGAFYGMWTWLLHSVFDANIVYIPAVLGALFGAVPLVGTYWAAIPGVLELFWGHNSPFMALLLFVAQLLPLSCVDTAIYAEIKGGGHPYLTGLAVAGGIFGWGVQGAILGPLVLCILLVVTKVYTSLIQPPSNEFAARLQKLRRCTSEVDIK